MRMEAPFRSYTDRDGLRDVNEPQTTTAIEGQFTLKIPRTAAFDVGILRTAGGIDAATGQPVVSVLSEAPFTGSNITPLTTLVHYLVELQIDPTAARFLVQARWDLDPGLNLVDFDYDSAALQGNSQAVPFLLAASDLQNIATKLHYYLCGNARLDVADAMVQAVTSDAIYSAMANQLLHSTLDLASPTDLAALVRRLPQSLQRSVNVVGLNASFDVDAIELQADDLGQILAAGTRRSRLLTDQVQPGLTPVHIVSQVNKFAQSDEAPVLAQLGRGELSTAEVTSMLGDSNGDLATQIQQVLLPPRLTRIPDQIVREDEQASFTFSVFDFETPLDELVVSFDSDNPTLLAPNQFGAEPSVEGERIFSFTPTPNSSGVVHGTVTVTDADGFQQSQDITITVQSINDVPKFTAGVGTVISDNRGPVHLDWASDITAGTPQEDELQQFLAFQVSVSPTDEGLFAELPTIDPVTGVLSYMPSPSAMGVVNVGVTLIDGGHTDEGGRNISDRTELSIIILPSVAAPRVLMTRVNPDHRLTPVDGIQFFFNEPVQGFDLTSVIGFGKYEGGEPAAWEEGDWNADGVFDAADLIAAFRSGNYQKSKAANAASDATEVRLATDTWAAAVEGLFVDDTRRKP